ALKGSSLSTMEPIAPKANLFTRRWSPTSRLSSIEGVGILKAWTMKVVPKRARMTVMTSDSKYSRAVDFLNVISVICAVFLFVSFQSLKRVPRRCLFRRLLSQTDSMSNRLTADIDFHRKQFLMIRPRFTGNPILCVLRIGLQPLL